jgi:hypothetical protein
MCGKTGEYIRSTWAKVIENASMKKGKRRDEERKLEDVDAVRDSEVE